MTPTQIARRSDALYADGTCGMTRRVLCDMVAQRESDLEDARAENAKLRELVRDAWGNGHPDRSCEDCDIRDECRDDTERLRKDGVLRFSRCLFELRIEERMRELGVEVDG